MTELEGPEYERTDRAPDPKVVAIEEALGTLAQWISGYSGAWADGQQRKTVVLGIDDERIVIAYRTGPSYAAQDGDPVITLTITAVHENAPRGPRGAPGARMRGPRPVFGKTTDSGALAANSRGFPASFDSSCDACGNLIAQGDLITRDDDGCYVHVECA